MLLVEDFVEQLKANLGSTPRFVAARTDPVRLRAHLESMADRAKALAQKRIDPLYAQMDDMFASAILDNMDRIIDGLALPPVAGPTL